MPRKNGSDMGSGSRRFIAAWHRPGDVLVVLGDESQEHPGIALMKESFFLGITKMIRTALQIAQPPEEKEGE